MSMNNPYYESLSSVLNEAYDQASCGKGVNRHAYGEEKFENQVICEIAKRLNPTGFSAPLFQAVKKIYESTRLDSKAAKHELLGAINYIAASIILIENSMVKEEPKSEVTTKTEEEVATKKVRLPPLKPFVSDITNKIFLDDLK